MKTLKTASSLAHNHILYTLFIKRERAQGLARPVEYKIVWPDEI